MFQRAKNKQNFGPIASSLRLYYQLIAAMMYVNGKFFRYMLMNNIIPIYKVPLKRTSVTLYGEEPSQNTDYVFLFIRLTT